jgi:hypothetical protein
MPEVALTCLPILFRPDHLHARFAAAMTRFLDNFSQTRQTTCPQTARMMSTPSCHQRGMNGALRDLTLDGIVLLDQSS